jgi:MSHA pilin protein MshA
MKAKQQSGFTLIELIMVIVILGIMAAVAIPQFVDLRGEARTASAEGVAGALGLGADRSHVARIIGTSTYAARIAGNPAGTAITADAAGCTAHGAKLQGGMPAGFTIGGAAPACTVTGDGVTANWTAIVVP